MELTNPLIRLLLALQPLLPPEQPRDHQPNEHYERNQPTN